MTDLSRQILADYQVRKTKEQKLAFIRMMQEHFPSLQVQQGGFIKCRNLIIGDVENAKVILSAHYDTCAWLPVPNFIMPKSPVLSFLYSILVALPLTAVLFLILGLLNIPLNLLSLGYWARYWISLIAAFGLISLLITGPANKHTANDNTSGVITLCELLQSLSETERSKVAFVFFDHEESGMLGSSYFRSQYKKRLDDKLLINFDCVSDGDHMLVAASKAARENFGEQLDQAFRPTDEKSILLCNAEKVYYPSDQVGFKQGVAIASLNYKPIWGYYIDKIHTSQDTVMDVRNIKLLCDSILRLLKTF